MRVDTGEYTGDGAGGGKTITLTNCSGDCSSVATMIFIVAKGTYNGCWTTDNFAAGTARILGVNANAAADLIDTLTTGAFTVDGNYNVNTEEYVYIVLQYDGSTTDIETGSYTGNGNDSQTGLLTFGAWTPDAVMLGTTDGNEKVLGKTGDEAGDSTCFFALTVAAVDCIQAINSGNCELGTRNDVNESGSNFEFVVLGEVSGYVDFNAYVGDGNDNVTRATTGNFTPDFAFLMHDSAVQMRAKEIGTDDTDTSHAFSSGTASAANAIQDFVATGIEVGSDAAVNANGVDFFMWAFKNYAGAAVGGLSIPNPLHRPLAGPLGGPI